MTVIQRNMSKFVKFLMFFVLSLCMVFISSFAWLTLTLSTKPEITGTIVGNYFEMGDGTQNTPYVIARPIQLYYFSWLQNLGYFDSREYYFVLGADIDMSRGGTQYTIPPIGTTEHPFNGHFSGCFQYSDQNDINKHSSHLDEVGTYHVISNVTVSNQAPNLTNIPSAGESHNEAKNAQCMGLFGVVGPLPVGEDEDEVVSTASIQDFAVDNITIVTQTPVDNKSVIGLVVGYLNGNVSGVAVCDSKIQIGNGLSAYSFGDETTSSVQSFSLVGYSKDTYDAFSVEYTTGGDDFGGSIGMSDLYSRLSGFFDLSTQNANLLKYTTAETIEIDVDGTTTTTVTATANSPHFLSYQNDAGYYSFNRYGSGSTAKTYLYLYGQKDVNTAPGSSTQLTKTVTTIVYTNETGNYIYDSDGHYLNATASGVSNSTDKTTVWRMSSTTGNRQIYTQFNGTTYYLYNNNGQLQISTNSTTWTVSGNQISSGDYNLVYDNGWKLVNRNALYIRYGSNYLTYNSTTTVTNQTNQANATQWIINGSYIYCQNGTTNYYLRNNNGTLALTNSQTNRTSWTITTNQIYNGNYYLTYDNGWKLMDSNIFYINNGNNYLTLDGTTITNQTNQANATKWIMDGNYIKTATGTTYYLRNNNGTLQVTTSTTNRTSWTVDNTNQTITTGNYYLNFNGTTWDLIAPGTTRQIITDGNGHYFALNSSNGVINVNSPNAANTITKSGNYLTTLNNSGATAYINRNNTSFTISTSTWSRTSWTTGTNTIYLKSGNNYYFIYYNGTTWAVSTAQNNATGTGVSNKGYLYNFVDNTTPSSVVMQGEDLSIFVINRVLIDTSVLTVEFVTPKTTTNVFFNEQGIIRWATRTTSTQPTSYHVPGTYIPLLVDEEGNVADKNTGYIVSGSQYNASNGYKSGDIRVSQYSMSDISTALNQNTFNDSRLEVVTRTYLSNGFVRISDSHNASNNNVSTTLSSRFSSKVPVANLGLTKYESSRSQLQETLTGSSNIYGLHFMDAQINKNNLIIVPSVKIGGRTYTNYELPEDCIDFNLKKRGYLNFFAGTYFSNNDSFFSLHQITRDENEGIVNIREIVKIYGLSKNGIIDNSKPYVYRFADDNSFVIPENYVEIFDTNWIKNPTIVQNAVYYFEIPVNSGEYALGSVDGGTGAYLLYLDIGASALNVSEVSMEESIFGIDFVASQDITKTNIASTIVAIQSVVEPDETITNKIACAVIVVKDGYAGEISYRRIYLTDTGQEDTSMIYANYDPESEKTKVTCQATGDVSIIVYKAYYKDNVIVEINAS